jgi:hypothetical protein
MPDMPKPFFKTAKPKTAQKPSNRKPLATFPMPSQAVKPKPLLGIFLSPKD